MGFFVNYGLSKETVLLSNMSFHVLQELSEEYQFSDSWNIPGRIIMTLNWNYAMHAILTY